MKTVKRFSSFEDLKASDRTADDQTVVMRRHRAFERLLAYVRAHAVRLSDSRQKP